MMKLHKTYPIWIGFSVLALAILACIGNTPVVPVPTPVPPVPPTPVTQNLGPTPEPSGPPTPTIDLAHTIKATVQIYGLFNVNGKLEVGYSGSGTLISSTGLILTNAHVASPASRGEPDMEPAKLGILLIDKEDKPPVPSYFAVVKAVDGYMDLAVLQITSTLDGTTVDPSTLNLPFVPLGNSDNLFVGQHINIFGYPGIGGDTITFTDGLVSGFNPEQNLGDRAWVKTNAVIAGGNSGGLAADDAGAIIGVPSIVASGSSNDPTDCRPVHDTNGDGTIDSNDFCVPLGGFLNGIRTVNLALPLIRAVEAGQTYVSPFGGPTPPPTQNPPQLPPTGTESFSAITWMTAASDCTLQAQVTSYPSGIDVMAAAWSFNGMTDGEPWSVEYKLDGTVIFTQQYSWNAGSQGNYSHCLTSGQGFPDGTYHISLFAGTNNTLLTQADVVVGGGTPPQNPSGQGVVTISGQVVDGDSLNPLPGAEIYVLNPGITFTQWKADQGALSDVFTSTKADDQGNFVLPDKLALNVSYTIVFYSEGYLLKVFENQTLDSTTPVNLQLLIKMNK